MNAMPMPAPAMPGMIAVVAAALILIVATAIAVRPEIRRSLGRRVHLAYKKTALGIAGSRAWPSDTATENPAPEPVPEPETVR